MWSRVPAALGRPQGRGVAALVKQMAQVIVGNPTKRALHRWLELGGSRRGAPEDSSAMVVAEHGLRLSPIVHGIMKQEGALPADSSIDPREGRPPVTEHGQGFVTECIPDLVPQLVPVLGPLQLRASVRAEERSALSCFPTPADPAQGPVDLPRRPVTAESLASHIVVVQIEQPLSEFTVRHVEAHKVSDGLDDLPPLEAKPMTWRESSPHHLLSPGASQEAAGLEGSPRERAT